MIFMVKNMKKYFKTFILATIIGFFLGFLCIRQYKDKSSIKVVGNTNTLYFIQYGVFSTKENMEENTINLQNYIYNINEELYYVYVGITKNKSNAEKISIYFNDLGYSTIIKEYDVNNKKFIKEIESLDDVLINTEDKVVIGSIASQSLEKYESVVNGSRDKANT